MNQTQLDSVQQDYHSLRLEFQSLRNNLEAVSSELAAKDHELDGKCAENACLLATIEELQEKCQSMQAQVSRVMVHCISVDLNFSSELFI